MLWVNRVPVELNPFVEELLTRTVAGAVSSLKGAEDIEELEVYIEQGDVRVIVNGKELPLTPFLNPLTCRAANGAKVTHNIR